MVHPVTGRPVSSTPVPAGDPAIRSGPPCEARRLSRQCQAILALFQLYPNIRITNRCLAAVSLKYTSRISDLRRAGYRITLDKRDRATGLTLYRLDEVAS